MSRPPGINRAVRPIAVLVAAAAALGGCAGSPAATGDPQAGARLIEEGAPEPGCERCHSLADAGFEGRIGPDLDAVRPGYQRVLDAVRDGPGLMPSYADQLDDRALHDIAAYISGAAAR